MLARSVADSRSDMKAVSKYFSRIGSLGGLAVSEHNHRRAGHAAAAKMFHKMAVLARQEGDQAEAEAMEARAQEQEMLATMPQASKDSILAPRLGAKPISQTGAKNSPRGTRTGSKAGLGGKP